MNSYKFLLLLLSFVFFINYINYLLPDRDKLHREIKLLEQKIEKEKKLNKQDINISELTFPYSNIFFDSKQYSYSQAMGKLQEMIHKSSASNCKVLSLKWAQVPVQKSWYEKLKINLTLECTPKQIFIFINNLRKSPQLTYIQNFKVMKERRKQKLKLSMQVIAYRKKSDK